METDVEIAYVPAQHRYELLLGGHRVGLADVDERGDVVVIPHTEIDAAHQGQGLAGRMVGLVLDDLRAKGRRVVPVCSYVVDYIRRHPEYDDLVAGA